MGKFLEVENLSFKYETGRPILQGLSFSLEAGQTLAVVGVSGCGKSTLLKIISDILGNKRGGQLSGTITIDTNYSPEQYRLEGKLSYMFQEPTLLPHLNVEQNIGLPLQITGKALDNVHELIDTVGLSDYRTFLPHQLSGGMKTRVSLARSFVTHPRLLLLDEPFSTLDIAGKSILYKKLDRIREKEKTTIVLVTHDVEEALLLADIIIVMKKNDDIESIDVLEIKSSFSRSRRLDKIPKYLSETHNNFIRIQRTIMIDGWRDPEARTELIGGLRVVLERMTVDINQIGIEQSGTVDYLESIIDAAKPFAKHEEKIHSILVDLFYQAKLTTTKYHIMWDILEFIHVSADVQQDIYKMVLENIDSFYRLDSEWSGFVNIEKQYEDYFNDLKQRFHSATSQKKWLYLLLMSPLIAHDYIRKFIREVDFNWAIGNSVAELAVKYTFQKLNTYETSSLNS